VVGCLPGPRRGGPVTEQGTDELATEFDAHRSALIGAAYRIVGTVADAEDVVQEAWLRWAGVERAEVRDARAFLVTVTTRLALNRLRQQQNRREAYVGPWLPEPVASGTGSDPAGAAEVADSVSMAMLVVLESLSPLERAAFVMREVFDLPFGEIAATLDRSEAAVRQLAHRARSHVQARQPRQVVDRAEHAEITTRFLQAAGTGDVEGVVALLAPDVTLISDGGGKRQAALRPLYGADNVARWMIAIVAKPDVTDLTFRLIELNGELAIAAYDGDIPDTVGFLELGDGGVITDLYLVRNPDKLGSVPLLSELPPQ
jgi:RNA polymerase sigma-70 factor (ECF subfamily)